MKYEGKKPRGVDKEFMGHSFFMAPEEIVVVKQVLVDAHSRTPNTMDTMTFKHRLDTIIKELTKCMEAEGIKPRNFAHSLRETIP